ncbi:hypothetical protein LEP1GSC058_4092 [Leptospira fainei serovar Hurstbridge str. BUT 6]|uniref:Uncharacterized protein n=1 Tax=Leptospira fainei serovar Hurstbridge str. BUT 6 TaxID=1193011 RepID=S3UX02_9LEPT|nr:hypothetical protein LEP1GSC058_4092 [Leptospira fainei serovar Hurstbridge str. BUT 6]
MIFSPVGRSLAGIAEEKDILISYSNFPVWDAIVSTGKNCLPF